MFTRYRKLALVLPFALALGACEKGLDAIGTNPNNATVGNPAYVLTNAQRSNVYRLFDIPVNQDGGLLIVQHWAKAQYTEEDRYQFRDGSYQSIWDGFYANGLQDFNYLVKQGETTNNPNLQAVGLIMRSYFFSVLTDVYGDIPYSQALRLQENIITPKYDRQEDVYKGLLADLKRASSLVDASGSSVGGDIIYGGDMDHWKRFANSLRLRLAMRISDANEALTRTEVAELLNGTTPLFRNNADNAEFVFLAATPNTNPIYENRLTRDDHRVSRSLTTVLSRLNDPRLPIYANPAECAGPKTGNFAGPDSTGLYRGIPNGLTTANANAFGSLCSSSKVGSYFTSAEAPGVLMTYAEVLFFKAEAIARGYITGDASAEYRNAIRASLGQYGIDAAGVTAYLAQPSVNRTITAANYREVIGTQKWIALYGQGVEAWSEFRRLDYPRLSPAKSPAAAAAGKFPVRFRYPTNEQSVNAASRAEAVARQGADVISTKLWWDKF
ncbi:SusD/RagB family nutrient-binding outer membrane lipoprotein [Hymenobacter metallicola]|uniref:SusD/RagB family nutrient-binding outer membrane lipoprotein n=1 Tax=Hymenobacter metallicola TaxID=2563114 RepID=A0A4Z0Q0H1_9BACT|nr:SusD/RagB family nutrient-binding outer membrane lipoprotein [Hymenobacter metallicola]TGE22976.1 SusD/RagB family nutrient-binding outer membrane lipoprotein [Hymenobacter metallicola]